MNKKDFEDYKSNRMMLDCYKEQLTNEVLFLEGLKNDLKNVEISQTVEKTEEFIESVKQNMMKVVTKLKQVSDAISGLEKAECRTLLQLRFVDGKTTNEVVSIMNISMRTFYRLQDEAFNLLGIED